MHFSKAARESMTGRIAQLGLSACPICESETLLVRREPGIIRIGGLPGEKGEPKDPESNILFMVLIYCDLCGHTMMFDSERLVGSDEPSLAQAGFD